MRRTWFIAVGIVVLVGLWLIGAYNGMIRARGEVTTRWADVETQYQRRMDLVPNLASTVRGAANFERQTFQEVTEARSAWAQATTIGDRSAAVAAANTFDSALSRLLVTVEAYPQLRATQAFRDFMTQLEGTENRISVARTDYNGAVFSYNYRVSRFPSNLVAGLFGFVPETPFAARPGSENAPTVDFGEGE